MKPSGRSSASMPERAESGDERRDPVALLDPQLGRAPHRDLAAVRRRGAAIAGSSSMRPGTSSGAISTAPVRSPSTTIVPRGSPPASASSARRSTVDARAEPAEHVEQRGARRVEPDVLDLDARTGQRGGGDQPERRADEKSPGTEQACARRAAGRPCTDTVSPSTSTRAAEGASARARCDRGSPPAPRR